MQTAKEKVSDIAAAAKAGMEKTKATMTEKVEKLKTSNPSKKDMATQKKEERINEAEHEKQMAYEENAAAKHGESWMGRTGPLPTTGHTTGGTTGVGGTIAAPHTGHGGTTAGHHTTGMDGATAGHHVGHTGGLGDYQTPGYDSTVGHHPGGAGRDYTTGGHGTTQSTTAAYDAQYPVGTTTEEVGSINPASNGGVGVQNHYAASGGADSGGTGPTY